MENSWEKLKADTKKAAVPSGENVREGTGFLEEISGSTGTFSLCRGAEGLLPGYDGWDRIPQQHRSNKEEYECKKDDR